MRQHRDQGERAHGGELHPELAIQFARLGTGNLTQNRISLHARKDLEDKNPKDD